MKSALAFAVLAAGLSITAAPASSAIITADVVLASASGGAAGWPFGGVFEPANYPVPVSLDYATDGDGNTFVSLPTGAFVVLGFSGGRFLEDGPGDDLFVNEIGDNNESADIFVSGDLGLTFTSIGQALDNRTTAFDLSAFAGPVNAIKIVGLDNFGASEGFDLTFVTGREGVPDNSAVVPLPGALPLLAAALGGLALVRRRRRA
jgi:hypothetical protein